MAEGSELVFVLEDETLREVIGPDGPGNDRYELAAAAADRLGEALARVHERLIRDRFGGGTSWTQIDGTVSAVPGRNRYLTAATPAGRRTFAAFEIGCFGPEGDPDAVAGISIWGRYVPIWADWRYPHGGSGEPLPLTAEILADAQVARDALAGVLGAVADAPLAVLPCFY